MAVSLKPGGLRRVFVANRGEIAVRVIRACQGLGLETVVGVSEADRDTLAARIADRAVCIGPAAAGQSYLSVPALITAALGTGCDAVHPGYGFLSEKADFARACTEHGLLFIGPDADVIHEMGDKLRARAIAAAQDVPTVPGTSEISDAEGVAAFGARHGYPLLIKAAAGGGGRGMRIVRKPAEVETALASAVAEASAAFGDGTVFIERYIERARHIEVQVMGDRHGTVLHFGERDCSTQRRHQKLIEEAPSTVLSAEDRDRLCAAAVRLAQAVDYVGAGTVEFIWDADSGEFYFLEMNTRIQVEHPVTEMVTGVDLVQEQIRCAAGAPLSLAQEDVALRGHAIECRINAESAAHDFRPSPGRITRWRAPEGPGLRIDTHCAEGSTIPPYYDSMIGKLIVHAPTRQEAIAAMIRAIDGFEIAGVETTLPFQRAILAHEDFRRDRVTTRWVEEHFLAARDAQKGNRA